MEFVSDVQMWAMVGVLAFNVLDILSGFTQAVVRKCVKSTAIREGLLHKASIWLIIAAVYALEVVALHVSGLSIEGLGTVPVCVIVIMMELVSVWENVCKANPALKNSPLGRLLDSATDGKGATSDDSE